VISAPCVAFYHPHSGVVYIFVSVCLSVCFSYNNCHGPLPRMFILLYGFIHPPKVLVMLKLEFLHDRPPFCQNWLFAVYRNIITKRTIISVLQAYAT